MSLKLKITGLALSALVALTSGAALAEAIIFDNVTLIDGTGAAPKPAMTVVVDNGKFVRVTPTSSAGDIKGHRIDGSGKYLIPGLMDMHIHLKGGSEVTRDGIRKAVINRQQGAEALQSYLYSGVTSVFDAGNVPDFIFSLRDDERSGKLIAPRVFATGSLVTAPGSHGSGPASTDIESWPEAREALDKHIARKPDVLKMTFDQHGWGTRSMIPLLDVELMQKVIEYYNDHGIRTTVHTSLEYQARQAIFAGVDTLAHPVIQGPVSDEFVMLMAAKKIPMTTTLAIGENYSRLAEHPEYLDQPLYKAALGSDEIAKLKTETRDKWSKETWTWWMKLMTPIAQENLRKIHAGGGVLALGTDQSIGAAVHREMELLAAAGIAPLDIIRIATLNGAVFLGKERDMGSVEEGKLADAVLLSADPSVDINNAKAILLVMKGGAILDDSKLKLAGTRQSGRITH
ncbi:amidohydrolase family protein [Govanella unica]|uniref:Amidohydrolase family protein n=1 Tax=Govanella unica TaxID=2975056 RepID=A0A9X3TZE9_9PROT|nr:amidohydrolase family protein [Govania unica]MDA5194545.1 amidohydrolase family protein [Govania unica]